MKFLFAQIALYLYRSMIQHCMDYCFHVWAGAHNFNLDILSKLQEQEDKVIEPTIASSLESLVDC